MPYDEGSGADRSVEFAYDEGSGADRSVEFAYDEGVGADRSVELAYDEGTEAEWGSGGLTTKETASGATRWRVSLSRGPAVRERKRGMDEAKLLAKLRALEALCAGATRTGEREAASFARDRLRERSLREPDIEYRFTLSNTSSTRLFTALVRGHDMKP